MMESPSLFLLCAHDGFMIGDTVKKHLEHYETTVIIADVLQISEALPSSALVLILTPEVLSVLKSPNAPDLKSVHRKSSTCALFFHDMINFYAVSVQQILNQTIPSFQVWRCYALEKKVRPTVLQILDLVRRWMMRSQIWYLILKFIQIMCGRYVRKKTRCIRTLQSFSFSKLVKYTLS